MSTNINIIIDVEGYYVQPARQTDYARTGKLYPKIDVYVMCPRDGWKYLFSTQQWRSLKAAKAQATLTTRYPLSVLKAVFTHGKGGKR